MKTRTWIQTLAVAAALGLAIGLAAPAAPAAVTVDELLAAIEGGWSAEGNLTPMGEMPFTLLFAEREDGSLHSRTALDTETYVDLRFARDGNGRWLLHEEAGMEGLGIQRYTLVPAGPAGGGHRWVYEAEPGFLHVDVAVEGEKTLVMDVRLRGEPHVYFRLDRLPDEQLPELARQMEIQAARSPGEGPSLADLVTGPETAVERACDPDPISQARCALAERPADGAAHLDLARALGAAIQESPANGPLYASEMLASLRRAIELEPELTEAYHWLAGYYLNAPPIAGGSLEKAEETARRLAELDAAGAERLLGEIAARRGGG